MTNREWCRADGFTWRDHRLNVPLDWTETGGHQIEVYARELRKSRAVSKPYLLYLQGGPGFESPRTTSLSGWLKCALEDYHVILLDQRGTGLSTPIDASLTDHMSTEALTAYLTHFRAPQIVQDAEALRLHLMGEDGRWTLFGQSFGGFCCVTYLSFAPSSLDGVLITGGMPPIGATARDVYQALYPTVIQRNERFYKRYPQAISLVQSLFEEVQTQLYRLPNGDHLSVRRMQSLGIMLGRSDGAAALFHLLEKGTVRDANNRLTQHFLYAVQNATSFHTNPIYAVLHEAIYCEGAASNWAAESVRPNRLSDLTREQTAIFFDGEMVFPWMFDGIGALQPFKAVGEQLASKSDWRALYDVDVLKVNTVPVVCLIYDEDMYVDRSWSIRAAEQIGACVIWSTNEFEHDGIRTDGRRIFERLTQLLEQSVV